MSKPKTTARVIVTYNCNRSCPGCCNSHGNTVKKIKHIHDLLGYEEIIITGGEPMLLRDKVTNFVDDLRKMDYEGLIFLYTASWNINVYQKPLLESVDGITFTLHAESMDSDIIALKRLSIQSRLSDACFSSRLIIDNRLYNRYDFSNIDLTNWDVIRKLQWKDDCSPAVNEELVEFLL